MAKKKKKNKQPKENIIETKFVTVIPGMMMSAKALIEKSDLEWNNGDAKTVGTWIAAVIMSAHCAELLLKYKIEREGHIITRATHDLHYLYKTLNADSKAAIEKEFNEQLSTKTPPNGWESAESVFLKARKTCSDWRFAVQHGDISLTYLHPLYIAAVSVYKTIPILESSSVLESRLTLTEITNPVIKARVLHT